MRRGTASEVSWAVSSRGSPGQEGQAAVSWGRRRRQRQVISLCDEEGHTALLMSPTVSRRLKSWVSGFL